MTADPAFTTPEMLRVFSAEVRVQCMLHFEAALARALAAVGRMPPEVAETIVAACRVENMDVDAILRAGAPAGTPVIPLVAALRSLVDDHARGYVHAGATSQDVIDSGLMLQMDYGSELLLDDLRGLGRACAALAEAHRTTVAVARTLQQHALPMPFGLKAAQWLSAVTAQLERLQRIRADLVVQVGGAAGTLAAFGEDGLAVAEAVAGELHLGVADLPWHSDRDRVAAVVSAVGLAARAVGKIAGDIVSLMSTEVAEVAEAPASGNGGSSAMPHKRNPVDAVAARAAARLALGSAGVVVGAFEHEHERAAGAWQAEWAAVPDTFCYAAGAICRTRAAVEGLRVDADRMLVNLAATKGLAQAEALAGALATNMGRDRADAIVAQACRVALERGADLAAVVRDNQAITGELGDAEIAAALDPRGYLGSSDILITRAIARFAAAVDD